MVVNKVVCLKPAIGVDFIETPHTPCFCVSKEQEVRIFYSILLFYKLRLRQQKIS